MAGLMDYLSVATPIARDAAGDAAPAVPSTPQPAGYGAGQQTRLGLAAFAAPMLALRKAVTAPGVLGPQAPVVQAAQGVDNYARGVIGAAPQAPPVAAVPPATTAGAPTMAAPAGPPSGIGSDSLLPVKTEAPPAQPFRFSNLSPVAAQALAAFLPRQRQPIEQVQQSVTDLATAKYQQALKSLGAGATPEEYARVEATAREQYMKDLNPVFLNGMPALIAQQYNQGMP